MVDRVTDLCVIKLARLSLGKGTRGVVGRTPGSRTDPYSYDPVLKLKAGTDEGEIDLTTPAH